MDFHFVQVGGKKTALKFFGEQERVKIAHRTTKRCPRTLDLPLFGPTEEHVAEKVSAFLDRPVKVTFTDNSTVMISTTEKKKNLLEIRLHNMFKHSDDIIIKALARFLKTRHEKSNEILGEFIKKNKALINTSPTRRKRTIKVYPFGKYHNLDEIYRRVNEQYFDGKIEAYITWGQRSRKKARRHVRLGSYSFENKIIRIHPGLDDEKAPEFFIEFIVYHEMLHALLQVTRKNGRRQIHSREFRQLEKQHPDYKRACEWEKLNIHRFI